MQFQRADQYPFGLRGHQYDAAGRLTQIEDPSGATITYTLNAAGDRTDEFQRNGAGDITRSTHRGIDALGRTESVHGADPAEAVSYDYDYDIEGNLRFNDRAAARQPDRAAL